MKMVLFFRSDVTLTVSFKMAVNGLTENRVMVVLGAQWGDEGKGKVVDLLAEGMDVICR